MAKINWKSIKAKAEGYVSSKEFKDMIAASDEGGAALRQIQESIANEAADKFIDFMGKEAGSKYVGTKVPDVLTKMTHGEAKGEGEGRTSIPVSFSLDRHRDSLYPEKYSDGVYDIVGLLDKGYSAKSVVFKKDEAAGTIEVSMPRRKGMDYIESGVANFIAAYGEKYYIEDIIISDDYTKEA